MTRLLDISAGFKDARVLVVGDVMLDRFVYARVSRISPEAPVPVLAIERETTSLGGAGNVARNVASLGGRATLIGGRGEDDAGDHIGELLAREPAIEDALVVLEDARTTEKIRYVADQQQVMRADREARWPDPENAMALAAAREAIGHHDVLVISDYAKGFLSPPLVQALIALARSHGKPVIVDPKGAAFSHYDGATVITPNRSETGLVTGMEPVSDAVVADAAQSLLSQLPSLGAVLVTRGAAGLSLAERGREIVHVLSRARDVFDVSGAGDTVVAALALSLAAQSDLQSAARLANLAAGIAVTKVGTAAVTGGEIAAELQTRQMESVEKKIVPLARALEWLALWRAEGRKIGFTNGCFDLVHPGHISLLTQARARCDRLVVGLNADASVRRLKGDGRPVQDETARAIVLASLAAVDLVVMFAEDTPDNLIRQIRPDILIKGADYKRENIVGADFVTSYGGEVMLAELVPDRSTSDLIDRARK